MWLESARAWLDAPLTLLAAAIALLRLRGTWQGIAITTGLAAHGAILAAFDWRLHFMGENLTAVRIIGALAFLAVLAGATRIRAVLDPERAMLPP